MKKLGLLLFSFILFACSGSDDEGVSLRIVNKDAVTLSVIQIAFVGYEFKNLNISIFPNPATDLIAIQVAGLVEEDLEIELVDLSGKIVSTSKISKGSTIAYFDVQTVYDGIYLVKISNGELSVSEKVVITKR